MTHSLLTTYRIGWQDGCDAARAQLLYHGASHAGRALVYGSRHADVGLDSAHAGAISLLYAYHTGFIRAGACEECAPPALALPLL